MDDLDRIPQYEPSIGEEEVIHMTDYLRSGGWLTEHRKTAEFEAAIAAATGSLFCMATCNGTVTMAIALWARGIGPGDEVLVPGFTMIATPNAVRMVGATPILVDIEAETLCMDLNAARAKLTSRTRAVILVSLNGRAPVMKDWREFCDQHGLFFIEDAAQSLGSCYAGHQLGTFGDVGSFSFSPPKIVTTGQGGALVSNDPELYAKMKRIKDFGRSCGGIDVHEDLGFNFKYTDIQAVIGIEQMKRLGARVERKRAIYRHYFEKLNGLTNLEMLPLREGHTPWFVDIYVEDRDGLADHLKRMRIATRPVYPALADQPVYAGQGEIPVAQHYCARGLWLPSACQLTDAQIRRVCDSIRDFNQEPSAERSLAQDRVSNHLIG